MKRKPVLLVLLFLLALSSCVKESYDMDKLSGEVALNPGIVVKAVKGKLTLGNVVEPDDDLVFDDGLLKFVFTEDAIINFQLEDFYTQFEAVSFDSTSSIASVSVPDIRDTIQIEPGDDVKLKKMKVTTGQVDYTMTSWCTFDISIDLLLPSVDDGGTPLTETINVPAGQVVNGTIDLDGVLASFDSKTTEPFNLLPIEYDINVLSAPPGYDPSDSVKLSLSLNQPDFDYITGYFGTQAEESEKDTLDLDMEDFFSRLTGSIFLTSPSITISYDNSFGIPLRVDAEVKGINDEEEIILDRDPVDLDYPTSIDNREVSSSFTIDKTNSTLPELISMLPYEIEYYGSASTNPDGETAEDNIIFSNSSFIADMEVEIPLEFRIANLQLSDTTDNFFISDDPDEDNPIDMLEKLEILFYVENGFPLGASVMMELYDSTSMTILESITTGDFLLPAPVDANGRVTAPSIGNVEIEFTPEFLDAIQEADQIIISFTLNTTDNGNTDVKIYSDYNIVFSAAVKLKAGINFNFNSEDE